MSMGTTRVLRERKPSRPLVENYQSSPPQVSHHLPQAYGQGVYREFTPSSEATTGYTSPASSDWLPDSSSNYDGEYLGPIPEYIAHSPVRSYGRGSPLSIADPRFPATHQWTRTTSVPKKVKKIKKDKKGGEASIMPGDVPVPILSTDDEAPVLAIEKFVHRSTEDRHKETSGKNGKIPRPMNQFMLYRKAFQDKAKRVSNQNNHQVVSLVVSKSWKQESPEIRNTFARFSQLEKDHHLVAFPNYQFRPNKSNKSKKRNADDLDDDPSDLEEPDWRRGPPPQKVARKSVPPSLSRHYTPEPQHQYMTTTQSYPQTSYAMDFNNQHLYYDQPAPWQKPVHLQYEDMGWNDQTHYQDPVSDNFYVVALSGLPGDGDALLDTNFSNDVFGESVTTAEGYSLLPATSLGSGTFAQNGIQALDNVPATADWKDTRTTSMDAKALTAAFQDESTGFNNEYFDDAG